MSNLDEIKRVIPKLSTIEELPLNEQQLIIVKLIDRITVSDHELIIDWVF